MFFKHGRHLHVSFAAVYCGFKKYTIYTGGATVIASACARKGIQHCPLLSNYNDLTVVKSYV